MTGKKLTHALYLRETRKILTQQHQFFHSAYQPQRAETQDLTLYLNSLLPSLTVGNRPNIRHYASRFRYSSGVMEGGGLFIYAAQFGQGIILWGIVCGPGIERPTDGALGTAKWRYGGVDA